MGIAPSLEKWEDLPSQKIRPEKDVVENVDRDEHEHPAGKNNDGVITRTAFNIKILQKLIFNKYHILWLISLSWWKINIKEGKTKKNHLQQPRVQSKVFKFNGAEFVSVVNLIHILLRTQQS